MAAATPAVRSRAARIPLLAIAAVAGVGLAIGTVTMLTGQRAAIDTQLRTDRAHELVVALQRTLVTAHGETKLVIATPAYLGALRQEGFGREYRADRDLVILLTEDVHSGDLPRSRAPTLYADGRALTATRVDVLLDEPHHRGSVVVYPVPAGLGTVVNVEASVEGAAGSVAWERPYAVGVSGPLPISAPALLALFGGLLASMWPCLFQLSAYFLPSVAGLSLAEAEGSAKRMSVLKTAVLFVSGIVIVYTFAGAAAGYAAESFGSADVFQDARGPITFVAGLVVLAMAARIAVMARAPLVCKMPVLSMADRFGKGPLGTIVLGLAFATGCMTCFGAALVLGLFAYVVTSATAFTGAAILFLFSLGIAVPLVLAAVAMAKVLPLLGHLERNSRYLSLASAAIMTVYGLLLLTGSTHVLSDLVAQAGR